MIEEGQVEIIKENENEKDTVLAILNAGDSFGEMGLMQKAPRSASVRCLTPVGLLKISREDFKALTGSYSSLRDQLESRVSEIKQKNESTVGSVDEILKNIESKVESSNDAANSISEPVDEPKPEKQTESKPTETKQKPVVSTQDVHPVDKHVDPPPTFSELFKKGIEHENRDVLLTIEKDLERELYNQPTNTKLIKQYAELQNHLGFIENGLTLYYQYLSMVPNDVSVMARVGEMHRRLNQFDKCIHILEKAYPIEPQNISVISNLASSYRSKRQYKRAEDLLQKALSFSPNNSNIIMLLAQCFNKQNHPEKGEEMIRRQLYNNSDHIPSLIILIESLLMQFRTIDAEEFLNKANRLDVSGLHRTTLQKLRTYIDKSYSQHLIID